MASTPRTLTLARSCPNVDSVKTVFMNSLKEARSYTRVLR